MNGDLAAVILLYVCKKTFIPFDECAALQDLVKLHDFSLEFYTYNCYYYNKICTNLEVHCRADS